MNGRRAGYAGLFLLCLLMHGLVWLKTGFIPVEGGAGFDGMYYRQYIVELAQGQWPHDPYRMMRMAGFAPAILAVRLGLPAEGIVAFQAALNAVTLAAAALAFCSAIERLTGRTRTALLATGALLLSWPWAVMPVYYPLLSDHLALAASALALRAWSGGQTRLLQALAAAGVFIMPGLSLVPLALLALPPDRQPEPLQPGWRWSVFVPLALAALALLVPLHHLSDAQILHHPEGNTLGQPALKPLSMAALVGALLCVAAAWTRILSGRALWQRLAWRPLAAGVLLTGMALACAGLLLDWAQGFRGPSLAQNLLLQGMAAPAKPLVAHAVQFGPAFVLVLLYGCGPARWVASSRAFTPLVALVAFLPLLVLGSESRQWVCFFPLMPALVALNSQGTRALVLLNAYGVAFIAVVLSLSRAGDIHQVGSMLWAYLVYSGPWMPQRVYLLALAATAACLAAGAWVLARRRGAIGPEPRAASRGPDPLA